MAKERQKKAPKNPWERFIAWMKENEKVVMVILLLILAPFFAFTGPVTSLLQPSGGDAVVELIYGEEVTEGELKEMYKRISAVDALWRAPLFPLAKRQFLYPLTLSEEPGPALAVAVRAYREKARRLGIDVSDRELQDHIRGMWRELAAAEYAQGRAGPPRDPTNPFAVISQAQPFLEERKKELDASDSFDAKDWQRRVSIAMGRGTLAPVADLEETLRDLLVVGKLENYVKNAVQVTPEEAYEEYRKEDERRRLSWLEVESTKELEDLVRPSVKDAILEPYYNAHLREFDRRLGQFALKVEYLLIPEERFRKEAEESLTEKDIEDHYNRSRPTYRRPGILAGEAEFALRTAEEHSAWEESLYLPLAEVRDQVREKVLEGNTQAKLNAFVNTLIPRVFPAETSGEKAATAEVLAKELPFLTPGGTGFLSRDEAEEGLGDAYHKSTVDSWFQSAEKEPRKRVTLALPRRAMPQGEGKGRVLYTAIDTRPARTPKFRDIREEVKSEVVREEALRAIAQALEEVGRRLNEGAEGAATLESLAGGELEVKVGDQQIAVPVKKLQSSRGFVAKDTRSGVLMVLEDDADDKDAEDAAAGDAGSEEEEKEVEHVASAAILKACFGVAEPGKVAVAGAEAEAKDRAPAGTPKRPAARYLVRFDERLAPDPGGFEARRSQVTASLLREKQEEHFSRWRGSVFQEAFGRSSIALPSEPQEVARN
jgi:hypothetical protein